MGAACRPVETGLNLLPMRRQDMSVQDRSERAFGSFAFQPATSYEHLGGGIIESRHGRPHRAAE
jgi:hypothetical protein